MDRHTFELTLELSPSKWPPGESLDALFAANLPALLALPMTAAFGGVRCAQDHTAQPGAGPSSSTSYNEAAESSLPCSGSTQSSCVGSLCQLLRLTMVTLVDEAGLLPAGASSGSRRQRPAAWRRPPFLQRSGSTASTRSSPAAHSLATSTGDCACYLDIRVSCTGLVPVLIDPALGLTWRCRERLQVSSCCYLCEPASVLSRMSA